MSEKASGEKSESNLQKVADKLRLGMVATRRDFLGYVGGFAVFAGLSPSEWIFGPDEFARLVAAVPMAPGPDPHVKGLTPFAVILCRFNDLPPLKIPDAVFSDYVTGGEDCYA